MMGAAQIHYYPSAEEQWELIRRHMRGRMYAFLGVILGSAAFDAIVVWSILKAT
jgi:hypothetical protein